MPWDGFRFFWFFKDVPVVRVIFSFHRVEEGRSMNQPSPKGLIATASTRPLTPTKL